MHGSSVELPLSSLPTETHAHILAFCDDSTLATVSAVSFAFLEMALALLYRDLTVTGYASLEQLFYNEARTLS